MTSFQKIFGPFYLISYPIWDHFGKSYSTKLKVFRVLSIQIKEYREDLGEKKITA
jgi:hypothetical protein